MKAAVEPARRPPVAAGREAAVEGAVRGAFALLGGPQLAKSAPSTRSDVHEMILKGVPYSALFHLTATFAPIEIDLISQALGISTRTLRRQREAPKRTMPVDVASRTWMLAETMAKATEIFGGADEAARWLQAEAMGLDGKRPIDLLRTLQGAELVDEFLTRLEYGVYT
ncbi:MAG TPA: antitoxin Xre/MbcA/ParS toxin-binding domain-containing protein [Burkholderiaceae bacterium]|nr:antitoxin Xre/MbcA/ParS toxin-binding domain-containing protein [Burkholderiaceae bacterium]